MAPLEKLMHQSKRSGMVCAEGGGMQYLGEEQQQQKIHAPADQQEAQHGEGKATDQDTGKAVTLRQPGHQEEHTNFADHADCPQSAYRAFCVTVLNKIDRKESVI